MTILELYLRPTQLTSVSLWKSGRATACYQETLQRCLRPQAVHWPVIVTADYTMLCDPCTSLKPKGQLDLLEPEPHYLDAKLDPVATTASQVN